MSDSKRVMTQVTCPECGSIGANDGPCKCHICDYKVMMLPSYNGVIACNWLEYYRFKKLPLPKHPWMETYV